MRMADLFSGSGSASIAMKEKGWDIEYVDTLWGTNVLDWVPSGHYDLIWASPPCECFSVSSIGKHWTGGRNAYIPKDDKTRDAILLVRVTIEKIKRADTDFWILENPRGVLRKVIGEPTATTWYCRWGDFRAKPTDLWGKIPLSMLPMPTCKNGNPDHAPSPRGSRTGTQGGSLSGESEWTYLSRSRIPYRLSMAIEKAISIR